MISPAPRCLCWWCFYRVVMQPPTPARLPDNGVKEFSMVDVAPAGSRTAWRGRPGTEPPAGRRTPDTRRALQLGLAAIWVLDGVLQYQGSMYGKGLSDMLAQAAAGNPAVIARPVTWDASLVQHHLVLLNTVFATIQLLLGLGVAFRPTVKVALAASVAWSLAVWWFGEGLGGVLNGTASPLNGAPGAVILYALAAVLLWPADREMPASCTAARAVGTRLARALWALLWLSLAYFALTPGSRAPQGVSGTIADLSRGQPAWLARALREAAALTANAGLAASTVLAAALILIAAGVYLPPPGARATLVLAIVVAGVIWVFGQAFGGVMTGAATDPQSGPLLALLALCYWPLAPAASSDGEGNEGVSNGRAMNEGGEIA
jgi:hypothetical protein